MDFGRVSVRDAQHQYGVIHPDHGPDITVGPNEYRSSGFGDSGLSTRVCYHVTRGEDGSSHADHIVDLDLMVSHDLLGTSSYQRIRGSGANTIY